MSHHSESPLPPDFLGQAEQNQSLRNMFEERVSVLEKLGKTGKFPEGKITPQDEGEIMMAVGSKDGKVILDFGTPVTWIGMNPMQAKQLGMSLIQQAEEAYIIKTDGD